MPCRVGAHRPRRAVAVVLRPHATADHHRSIAAPGAVAELLHQLDRPAVEGVELLRRHADAGRPVRIGTPGRALEHEAGAGLPRQGEVRLVVAPELIQSLVVVEQDEGGELGQVEPLMEDEGGLDTPVGQEEVTVQLWQLLSVAHLGEYRPRAGKRLASKHVSQHPNSP